jgi:hypothetical protein
MAEFTVNPKRFDPYKNCKLRIKLDSRYDAGISQVSGLRPRSEVTHYWEGGDPSTSSCSTLMPTRMPIAIEKITLENEEWERDPSVKKPVEGSLKKP